MDITAPGSVPTDARTALASAGGTTRRRPESIAATWPVWVRVAAAAVLVGAFVAQLVNRSLLDMSEGYLSYFRELSANPAAANVSVIAGMFAPALLVGCVLIWFRISRQRSRIAAWISLISGVLAFTCLPLLMGFSVSAFALVKAGLASPAAASALETYDGLPATVLFAVYNNASMLTIFAAAWALWRSHAVYRVSVVLLVLFMVGDIVGVLPFDAHYLALAATLLMAVSFFTAAAPSAAAFPAPAAASSPEHAPFRAGDGVASIKP